jgi:hypothetical protein
VPLSTQFTIKIPLISAHHYIKTIDQGWLETLSGQGTFNIASTNSNILLTATPKHPTAYLAVSITIIISLISTIIISSS